MMTAGTGTTMGTRCPLCGTPIVSVHGGEVRLEELHPVALFSDGMGPGYLLCEDCFSLTELPPTATLN